MTTYIAYYRVSTDKQGERGLGIEAQKASVASFIARNGGSIAGEYIEVETGKGANALEQRPQLRASLEAARKLRATLIIAKLDRLARNVHFITGLIETNVDFICVDMPEATKAMLQMYAVMAEWERDQISSRTKAALAAAKARGVRLGNPQNLVANVAERQQAAEAFAAKLAGVLEGMKSRGLSQRAMVVELNGLGVRTHHGGTWTLSILQRVLARLPAAVC